VSQGAIYLEILEIKPLKNKKVKLYLIRSEDKDFTNEAYRNLREILENEMFRFAVIDLNIKKLKKVYEEPLFRFLEKFKIPYYSVDIPENVKDYLYVEILEKEVQLNELENEYSTLSSDPEKKNSFKAQNLKSWIELLKLFKEYEIKVIKLDIEKKNIKNILINR